MVSDSYGYTGEVRGHSHPDTPVNLRAYIHPSFAILISGQLWQIAKQMTTLDVSNLGQYGSMGGKGGTSLSDQHAHFHDHDHSHGAAGHGHGHKPGGCCPSTNNTAMSLTSLERYIKFQAGGGLKWF